MNDLDLVAGRHAVLRVARARDDGAVDLDGDRPLGQSEVLDELAHGDVCGHLAARAVDGDLHGPDAITARAGRHQFQDGSPPEPQEALQLDVLSLSTLPGLGPEYCQQ